MAEGLCIGSMLIDGGFADLVLSGTSSHYCTAERQFRFHLNLEIKTNDSSVDSYRSRECIISSLMEKVQK